MSKQYTFIEMLQEYENGYTGEFNKTDLHSDYKITVSKRNNEIKVNNSDMYLTKSNLEGKYTKVEKELTTEQVFTYLKEGKRLRNEYEGTSYTYIKTNCIFINKLLEGKWYLE